MFLSLNSNTCRPPPFITRWTDLSTRLLSLLRTSNSGVEPVAGQQANMTFLQYFKCKPTFSHNSSHYLFDKNLKRLDNFNILAICRNSDWEIYLCIELKSRGLINHYETLIDCLFAKNIESVQCMISDDLNPVKITFVLKMYYKELGISQALLH